MNSSYKFNNQNDNVDPILKEIKEYNIFDFLNRVSALNLIPCNQNKCIVLDFLIDAILSSKLDTYNGTYVMSSSKFKKVIDLVMLLNIASGIDPIDMPFIQNVRFYGNKWVFNGVTPSCAYNFQNIIDVLVFKKAEFNDAFILKCNVIIDFVLTISTRIAEKCGYSLDTLMHFEEKKIHYPASQRMQQIAEALIFNEDEFDDFILENICCNLNAYESIGLGSTNYSFYYTPFVKTNDGHLLLLNPTLLVPFAINKILVWAQESGDFDKFISKYNEKLFYETKRSLKRLGHYELNAVDIGYVLKNTSSYKEALFSASSDGILFVRFFCDNGQKYENKNLLILNTDLETPSLGNRLQKLLECDKILDKSKIYVINILGGFGRGVTFSFRENDTTYNICFSPFELACIAINEENHPNFIVYYLKSRCKLPIIELPFAVELSYLTSYVENGYSFYINDDLDMRTTTLLPNFGDTVDYLNNALKKEDRHLVDFPESEYYKEVILADANRKIYYTTKKEEILFLNTFPDIQVWVQCDNPRSIEDLNVKNSICDLISYWLSECKEIFAHNHFKSNCILIKNVIDDDLNRYYTDNKCPCIPLREMLNIEKKSNNIWILHWTADVYHKIAKKDNLEEKELTILLIELFSELSVEPLKIQLFDKIFANPLKAKMFVLNVSKNPYFRPTYKKFRRIPVECEQNILDEIGDFLINEKGYTFGQLEFEENNPICNEIVGFLYSKLKSGIAKFKPVGLYEKIYDDLETIIYSMMLAQCRHSYDIACYPELSEQFLNDYNELNKVSSALKFLLEYVVAIPPKGNEMLSELDYDYYLTICSLIIEWANTSDLFKYKIISNHMEILQSRRIGFKKDQTDQLSYQNYIAIQAKLNEMSNPYMDVYTSKNLFLNYTLLDEAFDEEFGFTFTDFCSCVFSLINIGDTLKSNVKCLPKTDVYKKIKDDTNLSNDSIKKIIANLSLTSRESFLKPDYPYERNDVYPWKFNRRLSFVRRPISQVGDDLMWGNRQLFHSLLFLHDLIIKSKIKVNSKKFNALLGNLINQRGNDFNNIVANKIKKEMSSSIVGKKITKVNGNKIANEKGQDLGDIDVLVLIPEQKKIVVVEVKDFSFAKAPYELHQEYLDVFCDRDNKPCYVSKHKRRVTWIEKHIDDILLQYNLPKGKWKVRETLIVDETIISNEYFHKGQNILLYSEITRKAFLEL